LFTVTKESEGEKKNERITENSEKNNSSGSGTPFIVLLILCIILPPAAVGLMKGWFTNEFWISVILTLLVWIPGVIYAFLLLFDLI